MINVKRFSDLATLPTRAHETDAGLDLYSAEDWVVGIGQRALICTDIAVEVRPGLFGLICDRSSMAKKGIKTASGVIDAGYTGTIKVALWNLSKEIFTIHKGDRIAQLVLIPVVAGGVHEVGELKASERGENGFGSSGA